MSKQGKSLLVEGLCNAETEDLGYATFCGLPPGHEGVHDDGVIQWRDHVETQPVRPETGPMRIGDDWPGIFIRGDDAFGYAVSLRRLLESQATQPGLTTFYLGGLVQLLESCIIRNGKEPENLQKVPAIEPSIPREADTIVDNEIPETCPIEGCNKPADPEWVYCKKHRPSPAGG